MKKFIKENLGKFKHLGIIAVGFVVVFTALNYENYIPSDQMKANVMIPEQEVECYYKTIVDSHVACGAFGCIYPDGSICDETGCIDMEGLEVSEETLDERWGVEYQDCIEVLEEEKPKEKVKRQASTSADYEFSMEFDNDGGDCYPGYNDAGVWCEELCIYEDGSKTYDRCFEYEMEESFKSDCEIYYEDGQKCEKCPDSTGRFVKTCREADRCTEFTKGHNEKCTICYDYDGEVLSENCYRIDEDYETDEDDVVEDDGRVMRDAADNNDVDDQKAEMEEMLANYDGKDWELLMRKMDVKKKRLENRLYDVKVLSGERAKTLEAAIEISIDEISDQKMEAEDIVNNLIEDRDKPEVYIENLEPGESSYDDLEETWNTFSKLDMYGVLYEAMAGRLTIEEKLDNVWEIRQGIVKVVSELSLDDKQINSIDTLLNEIDKLMVYRVQTRDLFREIENMANDIRAMESDRDMRLQIDDLLGKRSKVKELLMKADFAFDNFWNRRPWEVIDGIWKENHQTKIEDMEALNFMDIKNVYENIDEDYVQKLTENVDTEVIDYVLRGIHEGLIEELEPYIDREIVKDLLNNFDVLGDYAERLLYNSSEIMEALGEVSYEKLTLSLQDLYRETKETVIVTSMISEISSKWAEIEAATLLDDYEAYNVLEVELKELLEKNNVLAAKGNEAFTFTDTPMDEWYFRSIMEMRNMGIVEGYKDGNGDLTGEFKPDKSVTIAEGLKMLMEAANTAVLPQGANDSDHWAVAAGYVRAAEEMGMERLIYLGNLDREATREELAIMTAEIFGLNVGKPYRNVFSDYSGEFGHYIQAVYDAGIFTGEGNTGRFNGEAPINRAAMAKVVKMALAENPEVEAQLQSEEVEYLPQEIEPVIIEDDEPEAETDAEYIKVVVDEQGDIHIENDLNGVEDESDSVIEGLIEGAMKDLLGDDEEEDLIEKASEEVPERIMR